MADAQPLQALRRIVESGLTQQDVCEQTAAHADLAMDAPYREWNAFLIQRGFPCQHVLVHAVDESAVEVEEKGCFIACHEHDYASRAAAHGPYWRRDAGDSVRWPKDMGYSR